VIAVAGVAVLVSLRYLDRFRPAAGEPVQLPGAAERNEWRPFGLAAGAATGRAVVGFALQTFVPLFFVAELASTEALGNAAVAGMLIASAVGTLVGGHLADRVGFRAVVVWTLALEIPLVFALPYVGTGGAYVLMVLIGMVGGANFYPLVVIAQNALPRYLGLAAGVVLGLAIGIGAGIVALLGVLADATSLTVALLVVGGAQVVSFLLAAALPAERRSEKAPLQDAVSVPGEA
jgi:MFS transporter, FSR family, fosmidomycin resistance protein